MEACDQECSQEGCLNEACVPCLDSYKNAECSGDCSACPFEDSCLELLEDLEREAELEAEITG